MLSAHDGQNVALSHAAHVHVDEANHTACGLRPAACRLPLAACSPHAVADPNISVKPYARPTQAALAASGSRCSCITIAPPPPYALPMRTTRSNSTFSWLVSVPRASHCWRPFDDCLGEQFNCRIKDSLVGRQSRRHTV